IKDRLAGIEAFDQQQVHPGIEVLAGGRGGGNVDAPQAICPIGVVGHVEWAVAGRYDRGVVDRCRSLDPNEWAITRASRCSWRRRCWREAVGSGYQRARRAEIRLTLEIDDRLPELILVWGGLILGNGLHAVRTTVGDI